MEWVEVVQVAAKVFSFLALVVVYLLGRKHGRAADRKEVIDALNKYANDINAARDRYSRVDTADDAVASSVLSGRISRHVSEAGVSGNEDGNDRTLP